jgi:glutamate racemase
MKQGSIGVFDSGYGGLTILEKVREQLPAYDFLYLGDNARAPYGNRSFEMVYQFTWQAVRYLFDQGCQLVVLACNTASAKALRSIQQINLPSLDPNLRVLGILRPTVEVVGEMTSTRHVGLVATQGTIQSDSYPLEIHKFYPDIVLTGEACPMWVPLVENGEYESLGADYFVRKNLDRLFERDPEIDTLILGCTHYPLLLPLIRKHTPENVRILSQGEYVASSLVDYLKRHPEIDDRCGKGALCRYLTTESVSKFEERASAFNLSSLKAQHVDIG